MPRIPTGRIRGRWAFPLRLQAPRAVSVIGLVGFGWTVATALVAPVLAAENVGPLEAVMRSGQLIRKAWGEEVIGNAGIGFVFGFLTMLVAGVGGLLIVATFGRGHAILGSIVVAAMVVAFVVIVLAQSTLQGIYAAALYRYATGDATGSVDRGVLEGAFVAKD